MLTSHDPELPGLVQRPCNIGQGGKKGTGEVPSVYTWSTQSLGLKSWGVPRTRCGAPLLVAARTGKTSLSWPPRIIDYGGLLSQPCTLWKEPVKRETHEEGAEGGQELCPKLHTVKLTNQLSWHFGIMTPHKEEEEEEHENEGYF